MAKINSERDNTSVLMPSKIQQQTAEKNKYIYGKHYS